MKKIFAILIAALVLMTSTAFAEVKTYTATGSYTMSPKETLEDGIKHAREDAMRLISESVGTYVESQSEIHNQELTQDEIKTISASIIHVTDESAPTFVQYGKGLSIKITLTAEADSSEIFTKQVVENKKKDDELEQNKKQLKESEYYKRNAVYAYDDMIAGLIADGVDPKKIIKQIQQDIDFGMDTSDYLRGCQYSNLAKCYYMIGDKDSGRINYDKAIESYANANIGFEVMATIGDKVAHDKYTHQELQEIKKECDKYYLMFQDQNIDSNYNATIDIIKAWDVG